ncbi:MAG TPA: hypothetical protein VGE52_06755, partial [Pirellulales bacterium]
FVHESRIFISDVRGLLAAIPTNHGLKTEQLVQRLNRYIEVFQEAVKAIKGVSGKISERPQPTPTEPPSARPTPTAAASLPPAATVDEFRQRLAAAKR